MTKLQEVLDSVQSSPSSIFSKEDVIYLLELANQKASETPTPQTQDTPPLSTEQLIFRIKQLVLEEVSNAVQNIDGSRISVNNVELRLDGNEIYLDEYEVDMDEIESEISDQLSDSLEISLIESGLFTPDFED